MKALFAGALLLATLAGCGRQADMVPMNDAANAAGTPTLSMELYGVGYGPATFTMPGGEVLNGHYHLAIGGSVSTGFATVSGRRGTAFASDSSISTPMQNPFMLQAAGARGTSITCEGSAGGLGHGSAVCMTNHGAQYQMMF